MNPMLIVTFAVKLLDEIVDLLGRDNVNALLTQDGVRRANALADAAEYVKFGKLSGTPPGPQAPQ